MHDPFSRRRAPVPASEVCIESVGVNALDRRRVDVAVDLTPCLEPLDVEMVVVGPLDDELCSTLLVQNLRTDAQGLPVEGAVACRLRAGTPVCVPVLCGPGYYPYPEDAPATCAELVSPACQPCTQNSDCRVSTDVCADLDRGAILCGHVHWRYAVRVEGVRPWILCAGSATKKDREGLWVYDVEAGHARATPGSWTGDRYVLDASASIDLLER